MHPNSPAFHLGRLPGSSLSNDVQEELSKYEIIPTERKKKDFIPVSASSPTVETQHLQGTVVNRKGNFGLVSIAHDGVVCPLKISFVFCRRFVDR